MKKKTIGVSEDAYEKVMGKKQDMERATKQSVGMSDALDVLLGEKKNERR